MVYITVYHLYDHNTLIVRPMASRTDVFMNKAFKEVIEYLESKGCMPRLNVVDNSKCSKEAVEGAYCIDSIQDIDIQLVSLTRHHVNAAGKVITTFKENFITALPTLINTNHPMQLWELSQWTCHQLRHCASKLMKHNFHGDKIYQLLSNPPGWHRLPSTNGDNVYREST